MDERELVRVRSTLEEFAGEVFAGFARCDQRETGVRYLRGLMLDGRRKSMQPMAERLGIDHQQLQQFVTSSTWDLVEVRQRLAARAIPLVGPVAWVIDDTGFVKDGTTSPGVARQYSGTLGKVGNCQVAVSVHAATDEASAVLDWRLFLPESWDETCAGDPAQAGAVRARRQRAGIPTDEGHRPKWELVLEMLDELAGWRHYPPVLVGDAGYGDATEFRTALTARSIPYVLAVQATTSARPASSAPVTPVYSGRGQPPKPSYPDRPTNLAALAHAAGRDAFTPVTWRAGSRRTPNNPGALMTSHFAALRVRPANRRIPRNVDRSLPEAWLLVEWPPEADDPTGYWLSTLPADTALKFLVQLAKLRWRVEHDYRELKTGLGLTHFEGRSWIGWHRHVTLVSAAQLFLTILRAAHPKALAPA
jgi:SRSO17 transposase